MLAGGIFIYLGGTLHVALGRRITEIALQTGNRKLIGQMVKNSIAQAEVSFGIFKVNRIDFMRHRRRAYFAGNGFLFEVAEGDIEPHIAVEVEQNIVEAGEGMSSM